MRLDNQARKITARAHAFFLGPFTTAENLIEIDVTYACNLKCHNCNRSCAQAPSNLRMSPEQIEKFTHESRITNRKWKEICILGGEPLIHPEIFEIIDILLRFSHEYSPPIRIQVSTSGYGSFVKDKIKKIPSEVIVNNSQKASSLNDGFDPFNIAPCDVERYRLTDFTEACWITSECGMGLNMFGFYHCAVAGGIDRVAGFDVGVKSLPFRDEQFQNQKRLLCKYCGHFMNRYHLKSQSQKQMQDMISDSWKRLYEKFARETPGLSLY